jgi:hypothetical protein
LVGLLLKPRIEPFLRTVNPNLSEAFRQTRTAFRFRITSQQISSAQFAAPCSNGRREFEYTILSLEKVPERTHHDRSGSQLVVIRKRIPEKHLSSDNLCDDRPPEKTFACRTVHLSGFQRLRTIEPRHRKLKATVRPQKKSKRREKSKISCSTRSGIPL